jgi:hypothetical protein
VELTSRGLRQRSRERRSNPLSESWTPPPKAVPGNVSLSLLLYEQLEKDENQLEHLEGNLERLSLPVLGSEVTPGHLSSVGAPKVLNILNTWSGSPCPGNKGLRRTSSPKIQPIDHTSTAVE